MPLTNDIELNGVSFNVVPGAYKKGLRKPLAVSKPAPRKTGKTIFGPFERGVLQASFEDEERGWSSLTVGPVFDGEGVEPFPNSATHADAMLDTPGATVRAYGVVAGSAVYVAIGRRIYKSVALANGVWGSFTVATDLGSGFVISGLSYFQDDILISLSTGQDIRKLNTATNGVTIWRTGEKSQKGVAYAGQFIYAPMAANNQEELRLSGTKWNGNAVTHLRYLDAPIINMASFNGQVVIATRKSLYFMGGQPYPGEADDAAITGDSSRAPEWRGDPDPVMSHGVYAEGDDFTFLESYRGRLYTWLGGRVSEFDDSTEEANWLRIGPEGVRCYGACVAGDWLIVAVESRYGAFEAWGFDGQGWWLLLQRAAAPAVVWPMALAGAGNRDALLFRDGSLTYDLLRLRWRSTALHTYATGGEWVSSLIDGNDPTADKAWTRIGATFAAPGDRGNTASLDSVSFPLEYSIDGGLTWVTVEDTPAASGAARVLTRGHDYTSPPISRFLQLRQKWSSVSDWAPVLTSLWVEYENAGDYALAELAQAEYEAGIAAEDLLRRKWDITIDAGDKTIRRDGQVDAKTGRQAIAALWDAWELGTTVTFKDIDNDTDPVTYIVAIAGMEEKAAKPADGARWGESTVTLILEESAPGVAAAPPNFNLNALSDVTLAALLDGQALVYDSVTGQWVNETLPAAHDPVTVSDTSTVDLALAGQLLSAAVIPGGISHAALANLATGDPHPQYATDADLTAGLAGKASTAHVHAAGDVTSGQFAMARLASGAPDGTKFIRDDGVLAVPAGGGGSGAVFSSVTPESIVGTAVLVDFTQRYTIPANNAAVGKVYRLTARGVVSNTAGATRSLDFHVRLGGVTIASAGATNVSAGAVNHPWQVTFDLVVITTGAGGTAEAQGSRLQNTAMDGMSNAATVAFDTTVAKTFGLAVTPAGASQVTVVQRQMIVQAL